MLLDCAEQRILLLGVHQSVSLKRVKAFHLQAGGDVRCEGNLHAGILGIPTVCPLSQRH